MTYCRSINFISHNVESSTPTYEGIELTDCLDVNLTTIASHP